MIIKAKLTDLSFVFSKVLPVSMHLLSQLEVDGFKKLLVLFEVVTVYRVDIVIAKKDL